MSDQTEQTVDVHVYQLHNTTDAQLTLGSSGHVLEPGATTFFSSDEKAAHLRIDGLEITGPIPVQRLGVAYVAPDGSVLIAQ